MKCIESTKNGLVSALLVGHYVVFIFGLAKTSLIHVRAGAGTSTVIVIAHAVEGAADGASGEHGIAATLLETIVVVEGGYALGIK